LKQKVTFNSAFLAYYRFGADGSKKEKEGKSYKKLIRKFRIAVTFTLPIFIIAMP
jgi:hypothetical protein